MTDTVPTEPDDPAAAVAADAAVPPRPSPRTRGGGSLESWGYDDEFRMRFAAVAEPLDRPGRVLRSEPRSALVALDGVESKLPIARGLLARDGASPPTAGDFVAVRGGQVAAVLERRTAVTRAAPDPGRVAQVLAANVDLVLVAEPLGERWRPRRLERLLVVAWDSGAQPVVVLTKSDRAEDPAEAIAEASAVAPGVAVHAVSPVTGEGVGALAAELAPGSTAVILGRSGAGKSTLANALAGGDAGLATGPVRSDGKGRHTTVARELVRLANGALLIDTPGVRAIGLVESSDGIGEAFSDVEELAAGCRFADCGHGAEPGCAVKEAIAEGRLGSERLASYERLLREQERYEAKFDSRLRAERSAAMRRFYRSVRDQPHR